MRSTEFESAFADDFPGLREALAGQFEVQRELGRGGMGVVYLAREIKLDRLVALKVLPSHLGSEPDTRERFLREARTAARLAHPNVVPVYRADEAAGAAYFAMAFVDGESLADRVRDRGALSPVEAVPILRAVAWALAYAHAREVVHRDVKPDNILLERASGRTLVGDFGIAQHVSISDAAARLTLEGHVLGTVHYMSPEQVNGAPLDGRSDLYALGVVAYYVLSGRLPFDSLKGSAVLVAHATRQPPPLRSVAPTVPPSLAAVVDRCLAKRPEDRYATGESLADALERALAEAPAAVRNAGPTLPAGLPARLDEVQAAALWRRAAQLQADALHRLEARTRLAQHASTTGVTSPGEDGDGGATAFTASYRLADVVEAAQEAGISQQFVAMALSELPRGELSTGGDGGERVSDGMAARMLGTKVRSLGVSITVAAPPARALRAIGVVLQQAPYELQLRETVGAHPLDGGVIVFDLPGPVVGFGAEAASAVNTFWMATHQQLEARQVQVTLHQAATAGTAAADRTELTMTADLRPGLRSNVRASGWMAGTLGGLGAVFTGAIAAKGVAVVASAAVLAPALGIGLAVAGLSLVGYRYFYPSVVAKAENEMRMALQAVAAALQSEDVFGTLPGPGALQRAGGRTSDDDSMVLVV